MWTCSRRRPALRLHSAYQGIACMWSECQQSAPTDPPIACSAEMAVPFQGLDTLITKQGAYPHLPRVQIAMVATALPVGRPSTRSWSSQHTWPASKLATTSSGESPRCAAQAPGLQKQPVRSMTHASAATFSTSLNAWTTCMNACVRCNHQTAKPLRVLDGFQDASGRMWGSRRPTCSPHRSHSCGAG